MKDRDVAQILGPEALALLQECFDLLLARHDLGRDSEDANIIAAALFKAYDRGITDRQELMRLADIGPDVRKAG